MMFSERIKQVEPFMVMELLEYAMELERKGHKVIHMEIGEPDFDTPKQIIDAACQAAYKGKTHYTHSLGVPELRDAIANYKKKTRNIDIDPSSEIMVTAGSSPAFLMVLGGLLNPSDEVIITDPGYPCYQNFIRFFRSQIKYLSLKEEEGFEINPMELEHLISDKTKILIINSPSNPTGRIISYRTLKKIAEIVIENDILVISDEIYSELTYTGKRAPSILEIEGMKERTIVLDGFSKFWAMTGWRLGYLIAPPSIIKELNKINQNFFICAPTISQYAAIEALNLMQETQQMLEIYSKRREFIFKRLKEIPGLRLTEPQGAFYAFVNIKTLTNDSSKFSWDLLKKVHVASTPGISFGRNGEGYIRLSYCTSMENIEIGLDRLEDFIKKEYGIK